jgi:predicted RNA binding protein YcfA (HicA-like mRNA interferase family)
MGTTVLDPSASQFNPNAETKYPERTLNKMWDEQYVIKEMSYRDATKILKKHHYHLDRQQGSHEVWKDEEGHSFALPHKHHGKDLSKGIMHALNKEVTHENFADGKVKGKSRPGRVKKAGASCKGSVTDLRAKAKKASGEKAKMYHWCANMKSGKK